MKMAVHFNGNLPCAIDTETTGLTPGYHDILQIAIIPLNPDFTPSKEYLPFEMFLKPKRPENAHAGAFKVNKMSLERAIIHGVDPWEAVDRFEEWFDKLHLPEKKTITPLGHNYASYDRLMIHDWLGGKSGSWENYNHYFHWHIRDTMLAALYLNDLADWRAEPIPFAKVTLGFLCSTLKVNQMCKHNALSDALASAEVYKRLMKHLRATLPDGLTPHTVDNLEEILDGKLSEQKSGRTDVYTSPQLSMSSPALSDEEHTGCPE